MFRRYTPDDFDQHGYLKAPKGFYIVLLVLLRPYIVWVLSVANRKEPTALIEFLYPLKTDFFMGLATGAGALLVFAFSSLRRKEAYGWIPPCWKLSRWLLWVTLLADVVLTLIVVKNAHFYFQYQHAAVFLSLFFSGLYLFKSHRLQDFLQDWPVDAVKGYVPVIIQIEGEEKEKEKQDKGG
ncbi:MAG: hypothetical protein ACI9FJ_001461 [Alteromonadaceae bacterium]|jgi:hypothetical protein